MLVATSQPVQIPPFHEGGGKLSDLDKDRCRIGSSASAIRRREDIRQPQSVPSAKAARPAKLVDSRALTPCRSLRAAQRLTLDASEESGTPRLARIPVEVAREMVLKSRASSRGAVDERWTCAA